MREAARAEEFEPAETITEVTESNGWWHIMMGSMGFGLETLEGRPEPKVGDQIELRRRGLSLIIGVKLNGVTIFDKTDFDLHLENVEQKLRYELKRIEEFKGQRAELDRTYEALPPYFKMRLNKFRTNNPSFRWEFEPYEMDCCTEALKIASACKTPEEVERFRKLDYPEQKAIAGIHDGHSGNSFGMACRLAWLYLKEPDSVVKMHGALAALVGSQAYGCVPKDEGPAD